MMSDPTFHKGQDVWYINKDGQQVPAKVTGVDLSIRPVAYAVRLEGADHDRDTESPRLRPRSQNPSIEKPLASAQVVAEPEPQYASQKAPVSQNAYMANFQSDKPESEDEFGDFGEFKAADSPVVGPRFAEVPQFQSPRKNVRNEARTEMQPEIGNQTSENNKARLIASHSEKKPGENYSGTFGKPGSGAIPLDVFGEDELPQKDTPSFEDLYGPRHIPGGQNFSKGLNLPPTFHLQGSPKKPYKPAAEIQNPYIRAMFQNENPDSENRPNQLPQQNPVRFAQGGSSPAGSSDDFGDFEDAPQKEDLNPEIQFYIPSSPSQRGQKEAAKKLEPILQKSHKDWAAEHTNSISKAIFPSEIFQRNSDNSVPDQVIQKQNETKPDIPRQAETQVLWNKELREKQEESQEDEADEIPWYMDPVSFLQSQTNIKEENERPEFAEQNPQNLLLRHKERVPGNSASPNWNSFEGYQGNGGELFRQYSESPQHPKLINSHHSQSPRLHGGLKGNFEERSSHPLTRGDVLSALNFENNSHRTQAQHLSNREHDLLFQPAQSSIQNPYEGSNQYSPDFQPDFRTSHPTNHGSTFQHPNSLHAAKSCRNPNSESPNNYSHRLSAPESIDSRLKYGRNLKRTQTYPDMWTQMMQTCAEALANGQNIVREEQERKRVERLLASQRGKTYLEALAQIHLAYQLLDSSMKVHVPEERRPSAFQSYAEQCSQAWNSDVGSMPLEDVVLRVSPLARQTSFDLPRQAIRAIETSPGWRGWNEGENYQEPEWREGLCGITLLPVDELRDLHFAPWIEDRPCLILLANLWKNRIQNDPPILASRTSFSRYR